MKYKYYWIRPTENNSIEKFIYGILHSKAIITDSFHGNIFSIIFNKPFITFFHKSSAKERFYSLKELFGLGNRFFELNEQPDIRLLETTLNINRTIMKLMKIKSINFLKKNLRINR